MTRIARSNYTYVLVGLFAAALIAITALAFIVRPDRVEAAGSKDDSGGGRPPSSFSSTAGQGEFDALAGVPSSPSAARRRVGGGRMVKTEARFDVPTFIWADVDARGESKA